VQQLLLVAESFFERESLWKVSAQGPEQSSGEQMLGEVFVEELPEVVSESVQGPWPDPELEWYTQPSDLSCPLY
jgi:hypothetical protein